MTTLTIKLTKKQEEILHAELSVNGGASANDYFLRLMKEAAKKRARKRIEAMLLEGIQSGPATEMTKQDWDDIRAEIDRVEAQQKRRTKARQR